MTNTQREIIQKLDILIHNSKVEKRAYEGIVVEQTTRITMTIAHIDQLEKFKDDILKGFDK